jgi:hypothetical protein
MFIENALKNNHIKMSLLKTKYWILGHSLSPEIPSLLWNLNFHYSVAVLTKL